ncbi:MAG: hypothetical protein KGL11_04700 [Alphaproteobacteria bacterium]|nr:hypothetical protein [Alphaproteobacteria bacterium]
MFSAASGIALGAPQGGLGAGELTAAGRDDDWRRIAGLIIRSRQAGCTESALICKNGRQTIDFKDRIGVLSLYSS